MYKMHMTINHFHYTVKFFGGEKSELIILMKSELIILFCFESDWKVVFVGKNYFIHVNIEYWSNSEIM